MPSVTNVNVVPPCLVTVSLGWWVRTNTGMWKGGSSPHQASAFGSSSHGPEPPLNIRRPMMIAPFAANDSRTRSSSGPVSPPLSSRGYRASSEGRRSTRVAARPRRRVGARSRGPGPVTKPSSDIVISNLSFPSWRASWSS